MLIQYIRPKICPYIFSNIFSAPSGVFNKITLSALWFCFSSLYASSALAAPLEGHNQSEAEFARAPIVKAIAPQKRLTLAQIKSLIEAHPAISAYDHSAEADQLRAKSALSLPDPSISVQLNNFPIFDPSFTEFIPTNKALGFSQSIPNIALRKANAQQFLKQSQKIQWQKQEKAASIYGHIVALLISQHSLQARMEILTAIQDKYDALDTVINIEISAGKPLLYRISQIDIARRDLEHRRRNFEENIDLIKAELINWIGDDITADLPQNFSLVAITGHAQQFYGVRVAEAQIDISKAEIKKAQADFKPNWGINLAYQQRQEGRGGIGSNFGGDDFISGGVSFTLPLWANKRQEPNLRAAKADNQSALSRRSALIRALKSQWQRYDTRRLAADDRLSILQGKKHAIKEKAAALLTQYEAGDGDYSAILDTEIAALDLEIDRLEQMATSRQMIVKMNSLVIAP